MKLANKFKISAKIINLFENSTQFVKNFFEKEMAWITAMTTIKQKSIPKFECHEKNTYLRTYKQ